MIQRQGIARPQIFVTRRLPDAARTILQDACDVGEWPHEAEPIPRGELLASVRNADGLLTLITDRVDAELLDAAPQCRAVATMSVGYDNIDVAALTQRGVLLMNTPDVLTETTADLVWTLILATARRLLEGYRMIAEDRWTTWSPMEMTGYDVYGSTLGIIGAGRIGTAVARRASGFAMPVLYHNRRPAPAFEAETGARFVSLQTLLEEADVVVVLVPLTEQTRHMIGAAEFARMKPTAVFVNAARGPVIDEQALVEALQSGRPWAAGLDVFEHEPIQSDHPLLHLPNATLAPHIGSATVQTRTRMAVTAARNLVAALCHNTMHHAVNPTAWTRFP